MHVDAVLKCYEYGRKKPRGAFRFHVYELAKNRSLCGKWFIEPNELLEPLHPLVAVKPLPYDCANCVKRLKAVLAQVEKAATA